MIIHEDLVNYLVQKLVSKFRNRGDALNRNRPKVYDVKIVHPRGRLNRYAYHLYTLHAHLQDLAHPDAR